MEKTQNYVKQLFAYVLIAVFAFATIFSTSINASANAEVDVNEYIASNLPNNAVITQNDDKITSITYLENGQTYITSIDKELKKMYLEHNGIKYEMIVDKLESNEATREAEFLGHLVNLETGDTISFDDLNKNDNETGIMPMFAFAAPLAMPALTAALELLLLGATMIIVMNSEFVTASQAHEMTNKYKSSKYFAAWIYYPKNAAKGEEYVVIGQGISAGEAEARLMAGESTFARSEALAKSIFKSLDRGPEQHGPFPNFLPHYHGKVPNENRPGQNISAKGHSWYFGNIR